MQKLIPELNPFTLDSLFENMILIFFKYPNSTPNRLFIVIIIFRVTTEDIFYELHLIKFSLIIE